MQESGFHGPRLPPCDSPSYNCLTRVFTTTRGEANCNRDAWIGSSVSALLRSIRFVKSEPDLSECEVYQALLKCLVVFVVRADQVLTIQRPTCQF